MNIDDMKNMYKNYMNAKKDPKYSKKAASYVDGDEMKTSAVDFTLPDGTLIEVEPSV